MPRDPDAIKAHNEMRQANGEARWHIKTEFNDDDIYQAICIRPTAELGEDPLESEFEVQSIHHDSDGGHGGTNFTVTARELLRITAEFTAMFEADKNHHDQYGETSDEDEEEEEDESEEEEEEEDDPDEEEEEEEEEESDDGGEEEEEETE